MERLLVIAEDRVYEVPLNTKSFLFLEALFSPVFLKAKSKKASFTSFEKLAV
jgi:hypothetical protein